jgi:hypothetical protein
MLRSVNQNPFFVAANGVTIILKEGYGVGTTGKADGDSSNTTYTAVSEAQLRAMDVNMSALERNLLNFTLWNYCPDNSNNWGDNWNGEDLSLWSPPNNLIHEIRDTHSKELVVNKEKSTNNEDPIQQVAETRVSTDITSESTYKNGSYSSITPPNLHVPKRDSIAIFQGKDLNIGARALEAFARPYPIFTPGTPISVDFNLPNKTFTFTFYRASKMVSLHGI